jgi:transcriptional regulator with XRE-family HTH domain
MIMRARWIVGWWILLLASAPVTAWGLQHDVANEQALLARPPVLSPEALRVQLAPLRQRAQELHAAALPHPFPGRAAPGAPPRAGPWGSAQVAYEEALALANRHLPIVFVKQNGPIRANEELRLPHVLGNALRVVRLRQGRTLREVSSAARISLGYLSEVERGEKEVSSDLLHVMAGAVELPMSQVFSEAADHLALLEQHAELHEGWKRVLTGKPPVRRDAHLAMTTSQQSISFTPSVESRLLRHVLGEALRRRRLRQGRTLDEVSSKAYMSLGFLSEIERGIKEVSEPLLAKVCEALHVPMSVVFRDVSKAFALIEERQAAAPPPPHAGGAPAN